MNWLAITWARLLAECISALYGLGAGALHVFMGDTRQAVSSLAVMGIVCWLAHPPHDQIAALSEFQQQRGKA